MSTTPVNPTPTATPTPAAQPVPTPTPVPVPAKAKPLSDWVNVRLSAAGIAFAGLSGRVHVANGRMAYTFNGNAPQRVLRKGEATLLLAELVDGKPIFETVPDAPATT